MSAPPARQAEAGGPGWEFWAQLPVGLVQIDGNGCLLKVNPPLVALLGLPSDRLVRRPVGDVLPGLSWPMPGVVRELTGPGERLLAILVTQQGRGGVVAVVPVTELPALVAQLAEASAIRVELETVIEASFDEIFITDGEGQVLRVNAACERFYGLPAEALQGRNVRDLQRQGLFTPSGTSEVLSTRERQMVVQETRTGRRLVTISIPIFAADGTLRRVVSVARDVTDLNNLVAELQETEALAERYRLELHHLNVRLQHDESVPVYASQAMREILDLVHRVASVDAAVLITGESGVGKGQLARLFHRWGDRAAGPFQTIDCGALPESLIESELFGYEGGAFTGANREGKVGLIESAHGGTLFLDEIGELPLGLQVKLLRFLQEKTVTRVGGRRPKAVDVRVLAATNRDLRAMVTQGRFREDLFWRLNVVPIHLPSLRERPEDIPVLLEYFLANATAKYRRLRTISQEAMTLLSRYPWPGNVRELENLVVRLVVITPHAVIGLKDLPAEMTGEPDGPPDLAVQVNSLLPFHEAQAELERQLLTLAMQQGRSTRELAELLGVNQSTIVRKLKQRSLAPPG